MPVDQDDVDIAEGEASAIESAFNADEAELDESMMPVYEFEWDSGRTRRTDTLENEAGRVAVENLATLGRRDDECTVEIVGFEA